MRVDTPNDLVPIAHIMERFPMNPSARLKDRGTLAKACHTRGPYPRVAAQDARGNHVYHASPTPAPLPQPFSQPLIQALIILPKWLP